MNAKKLLLVLVVAACLRPALGGSCEILTIYDRSALRKGEPITVEPFGFPGLESQERLDDVHAIMAEKLEPELEKSKFFSDVRGPADSSVQHTGYVLSGAYRDQEQGHRLQRAILGGGGAHLRLHTILTSAETGRPVLDIECVRTNVGGLFGATGGLLGLKSGDSLTDGNIRDFAKGFGDVFEKMEETLKLRAEEERKDLDTIKGKTESSKRKWESKPFRMWSLSDLMDEIDSYSIHSNRKDSMSATALWLTASAYRSLHRVLEYAETTEETTEREIPNKYRAKLVLTDVDPVKQFQGQPVYLIVVRFECDSYKRSPFEWNDAELLQKTRLTTGKASEVGLEPVRILWREFPAHFVEHKSRWSGLHVSRCQTIIFAFPQTTPGGEPVVRSVTQELILNTRASGQDVRLEFNLADFGLDGVDQLMLGTEEEPQQ